MRRVAITGAGVVSAIGKTAGEFWASLASGTTGIRTIQTCDCSMIRFKNGAEISDFSHEPYFTDKQVDFLDRFAQFAVITAREAVVQSGIEWTDDLRERTAIVTGSCTGGQITEDAGFRDIYENKRNRIHPLSIPKVMGNAGASQISMEYGIVGPAYTVTTACASSAHAFGQAYWLVRNGVADFAITGGSEAPFSFAFLKSWEAMRVVSPDTCRPFSADRTGMVLGEGAAMFTLEPLDMAIARGATVLGEICGFGMSADASHITVPNPKGAARAMRAAMRDAGIEPEQVGYVNAHGTATRANDISETLALRETFGNHLSRLPVSSTKSMHGHGLGAAGALEAAATIFALQNGILPPTINYREQDPECDIDVIPNVARKVPVEYALSNSFAFGGLNAVLAFRHPDSQD